MTQREVLLNRNDFAAGSDSSSSSSDEQVSASPRNNRTFKRGRKNGERFDSSCSWCCLFLSAVLLSGAVIGLAFLGKRIFQSAANEEQAPNGEQSKRGQSKFTKQTKSKEDAQSNEVPTPVESVQVVENVEDVIKVVSDKEVQTEEIEAETEPVKREMKEHHDADYHRYEPPTRCPKYFPSNGTWCCKLEEDGGGCSFTRTFCYALGFSLSKNCLHYCEETYYDSEGETYTDRWWRSWKIRDVFAGSGAICLVVTFFLYLFMTWMACTSDDNFEKFFIFVIVA